jgi:hypothetical protein
MDPGVRELQLQTDVRAQKRAAKELKARKKSEAEPEEMQNHEKIMGRT